VRRTHRHGEHLVDASTAVAHDPVDQLPLDEGLRLAAD